MVVKTLVYLKIISGLSHGIKSWRWWSNLLGFLEVKVQLCCLKKKKKNISDNLRRRLNSIIIFQSWQVKCPRWCHQSCTDHVSVRPWTNTSSWSLITGRVLGSTADGQEWNVTAGNEYAALFCTLQWFIGKVNPPLSAVVSEAGWNWTSLFTLCTVWPKLTCQDPVPEDPRKRLNWNGITCWNLICSSVCL